jgi:hypothetical protein
VRRLLLLFGGIAASVAVGAAVDGETSVRVTAPRPFRAVTEDGKGTRLPLADDPPGRIGNELRALPAVFAVDPGNESAAPALLVRGLDASQNRWLVEDVPLDDAAYRSSPLLTVPSSLFWSVDGYPDGVPGERAIDGLGGAFVLRLPERCERSRLLLRGGAFRYGRLVLDGCFGDWADGRLAAAYTTSREDFPYFDDGGTPLDAADDAIRRREGNELADIAVVTQLGSWERRRGGLRFYSLHARNRRGLPGAIEAPTPGARLEQGQHLAAVQWGTSDSERVTVYALALDEQSFDLPPAFAPFLPAAIRQRTIGLYGTRRWGPFVASVRLQADRVAMEALGALAGARWRWQTPIAFALEQTWGPLTVVPELGFLTAGFADATGNESAFAVVSRFTGLWRLSGGDRVRLTAVLPARLPSLVEHYGSPAGLAPSPGLLPERALRVAATYEKELSLGGGFARALAVSGTVEVAGAENLIVAVPVNAQTLRATNIGRAELLSGEVAVATRFRGGYQLRGSLVALSATNQTPIASQRGNRLPMRAPWRASLAAGWASGPWNVSYEVLWRDELYRDVANRDLLGAVSDHSVRATFDGRSFGKFSLELLNVWNTLAATRRFGAFGTVDHAGLAEGFPGPGRRIYLSWALDF